MFFDRCVVFFTFINVIFQLLELNSENMTHLNNTSKWYALFVHSNRLRRWIYWQFNITIFKRVRSERSTPGVYVDVFRQIIETLSRSRWINSRAFYNLYSECFTRNIQIWDNFVFWWNELKTSKGEFAFAL